MSNLPKKSVVASKSSKEKEEVNAYGNISLRTRNKKTGKEKLSSIGIYGLMLRDSNKIEKLLIDLAKNGDTDTIEELDLVISITVLDEDASEDDDIELVTK